MTEAYALLGLRPGAAPDEVTAAYRARAKALHPDRTGEEGDAARMAAVNSAHEVLTAALLHGLAEADAARGGAGTRAGTAGAADGGRGGRVEHGNGGFGGAAGPYGVSSSGRRRAGDWLATHVRRALGPELLIELAEGEQVDAVVRAATWASPHTTLAITDRRVLWLLDDAVGGRVRSLRFPQIREVSTSVRGRRRRTATLRVQPHYGRGVTFSELPVDLAGAMCRRVDAGVRAARARPAP